MLVWDEEPLAATFFDESHNQAYSFVSFFENSQHSMDTTHPGYEDFTSHFSMH